MALLAALGLVWALYWQPWRAGDRFGPRTTEASSTIPVRAAVERRVTRPAYRYSVIAGGAYTAQELRDALLTDRVAAAHYADFNLNKTDVIVTPQPRRMYASYRIGDDVYWTSRPIEIAAGEALLDDGQSTARARCGNRLSDVPRKPTRSVEPQEYQLEATESPRGLEGSMDPDSTYSALIFDYFAESLPLLSLPLGEDAAEDAAADEATATLEDQIFQLPAREVGEYPAWLSELRLGASAPASLEEAEEIVGFKFRGTVTLDSPIPASHEPPGGDEGFALAEPATGVMALTAFVTAYWLAHRSQDVGFW